jgi:O-antigen/teichoic acid export membrane protein
MKQIIKDSAGLLSANVAAQALGLLVYPLLTRLYSPEDFGLLYIFTSVSSVLVLLGTAGYQFAIPLPKRETDGVACFYAGIAVLVPVIALLVLLLPLRYVVADLLGSVQLGGWLIWMPVFVGVLCLWNLLNGWWTRQRQFRRIGAYQVSNSVLAAFGKLLLGWCGVSGGLMWATVLAPAAAVGGSAGVAAKGLRPLKQTDWESCRQVLKKYKNFPLYTLPLSLINQFFGQLPAYLLAPMFGEAALGRWSMALLLSFAPVNMVCNSVYQVLFAHVGERVRLGKGIRDWFARLERWTLLAVVPVFAAVLSMQPSSTLRERSGMRCMSPIAFRRTLLSIKVLVSLCTALMSNSINPSTSSLGRFQFSVLKV